MSKWMIPRHKPRKEPEWSKSDRNHGRKFANLRRNRVDKEVRQQRAEMGFLGLVARQRDIDPEKTRIATMQIGQCARKRKLTEDGARKCARTIALSQGKYVFAYKCKWCGAYHITTHPLAGAEYEIKARGMKV